MIKTFSFENKYGDIIEGDIRFPAGPGNFPLAIFQHGFKSFRNWGFIPYLCGKIAASGAIAVNFDFSLNGIVDSEKILYDNDKFSRNTVSRELSDMLETVDFLKNHPEIAAKWNGELYLAGHSLGGAISLLAAENCRPAKLALWGTISDLQRNTERQKAAWKKKGFSPVKISSTGQELQLMYSYQQDKDDNFPENAILNAAAKYPGDLLIIHGSEDLTVKPREAEELFSAAGGNPNAKLEIIERTGHTFGVGYTFNESNDALDSAIDKTLEFLELK
jgi:dienelactone hydrolase